jgi:hypothetical protein
MSKARRTSKQHVDKTVRDYLNRLALEGSWADMCAVLFLEWYPVWSKRQHSKGLNWLQFRRQVVEAAKRFWNLDPQRASQKGRPSVDDQCFKAIELYVKRLPFDSRIYKPPTQGELIRALNRSLPRLKAVTCRKYARLWQLLNQKQIQEYSESDKKFLRKYRPFEAALQFSTQEERESLSREIAARFNSNKLPF